MFGGETRKHDTAILTEIGHFFFPDRTKVFLETRVKCTRYAIRFTTRVIYRRTFSDARRTTPTSKTVSVYYVYAIIIDISIPRVMYNIVSSR